MQSTSPQDGSSTCVPSDCVSSRASAKASATAAASDTVSRGEILKTYHENYALYRHISCSICRNVDDADDALQEAAVNMLYRNPPSVRINLVQWVARVVSNASIDHMRRLGRTPHTSYYESPSGYMTIPLPEIFAGLRTLPRAQRAAIALVDYVGLTVTEAALLMKVSPGTVKSRRTRGKQKLADILRDNAALNSATNDPSAWFLHDIPLLTAA